MGRRNAALAGAVLALTFARVGPAAAQNDADRQRIRQQIEARFTVLPVQGGVVLEPKRRDRDVQSVEVAGGTIAINGEAVTGAEARRRLGDDADAIIRLSFLDAADQRSLLAPSPLPAVPSSPASPALPTSPVSPPAPALAPAPPAEPGAPRPPRRPRPPSASDRVRIGGGAEVAENETVNGNVVAIGGSAAIQGTVFGDVVAIGGEVTLGPHAEVEGDVTAVGGAVQRDPGAHIGGEIREIGWGDMHFLPEGARRGGVPRMFGAMTARRGGSMLAFLGTAVRLAFLCILASAVLLFGRSYVERVAARAAAEPLKAGLIGFLIQLLLVPVLVVTVVVMIVTIVGIPLLALIPFALLALAVLWVVGFTAVAQVVGAFVLKKAGRTEPGPYTVLAAGIAAMLAPVLLGGLLRVGDGLWPLAWALLTLGFLVEYLAWTVGLGAVALARYDRA